MAEDETSDLDLTALRTFLGFRARSVTRMVEAAAKTVRAEGLSVGLDCFSPALTWMVGQTLTELDSHCDWIKIMSYGHALGPSGLPFELGGLADWLVTRQASGEATALRCLSQATHLGLPSTRAKLRREGLAPDALAAEVTRGRTQGVRTLLAGIELVEIAGVTNLNTLQITADLRAFREAGGDGLVLSWDLYHISPERLELVREVYL